VINASVQPAVSVHTYSAADEHAAPRARPGGAGAGQHGTGGAVVTGSHRGAARSIEEVPGQARARLRRLGPGGSPRG